MGEAAPGGNASQSAARRLLLLIRAHPTVSLFVIACGALGAFALVSALHRGEGEQLSETVAAVRDAVVAADVRKVMEHISPHFFEEGMGRPQLRRGLNRALQHQPVSRVVLVIQQSVVRGTAARMQLQVESYHGKPFGGRAAYSEWAIGLEKIEGRWLVRRATPISVRSQRVAGLRSVLVRGYH